MIPMKSTFFSHGLIALAAMFLTASASAQTWQFGVISDTQWTIAPDGRNPNTTAADVIRQVNQEFIAKGVKFVVAVGDGVDQGAPDNDYVRALYSQDLYNANIGFYPLRGNHEAAENGYLTSAQDFRLYYPQIQPGPTAGVNNASPAGLFPALVQALAASPNPPAGKTNNATFVIGSNFSAPASNPLNDAVSYAFRFNNATFMLLDQFRSPYYYSSHIPDQQPWIDATLAGRPANSHAFVFGHKNLLGGNHKDNLFGGAAANDPGDGYGIADPNTAIQLDAPSDPGTTVKTVGAKQGVENTFLASLGAHKVRYFISGHDHHHYISIVTSPDQQSEGSSVDWCFRQFKILRPVAAVLGE
jgi:hypothetical protein